MKTVSFDMDELGVLWKTHFSELSNDKCLEVIIKLKNWCKENCESEVSYPASPLFMFVFESQDDAVLFKLTWG